MVTFVKYFMLYLVSGELSVNVDYYCYPPGGMRPFLPSHPVSVVIFYLHSRLLLQMVNFSRWGPQLTYLYLQLLKGHWGELR